MNVHTYAHYILNTVNPEFFVYENIHVVNFRVNIFVGDPWKYFNMKICQARNYCTSRYIIYYTSLSCATAKCSQTPALNKTARYSVLEHVAMEISTYAKMVSNLTPYASFQCCAGEWLPLRKCCVCLSTSLWCYDWRKSYLQAGTNKWK